MRATPVDRLRRQPVINALAMIGVAGATLLGASAQAPAPANDPAAILSATREALGGERRLADVKSFVASGRTRQVRGDNLVPIEFEINCEFPDKYMRRDEVPAQENGPTTSGFNGNLLIQVPPQAAPVARAGGPPPPTPEQLEAMRGQRVAQIKQDFARLMLGLFATSYSSFPLTFTYVGTAAAPQGEADVLDAKGPANFAVRFFVYKTTHVPIMVSWQASVPGNGRGPQGRGTPPAAAGPPPSPAPAPPETRLYFGDYRDVDGLKLPFRIRRAVGAETVEETTFDRFRLNAKIDAKKFDAK